MISLQPMPSPNSTFSSTPTRAEIFFGSILAADDAFANELTTGRPRAHRIDAVPDPGDRQRSYVVCYIPESDHKPHRAELAGRNYYLRIGDSSVVPPVSLLRSLFYPGSRTSFTLKARKSPAPADCALNRSIPNQRPEMRGDRIGQTLLIVAALKH